MWLSADTSSKASAAAHISVSVSQRGLPRLWQTGVDARWGVKLQAIYALKGKWEQRSEGAAWGCLSAYTELRAYLQTPAFKICRSLQGGMVQAC